MAFNKVVEIIIGPDGGEGLLIADLFTKFEIKKSDTEAMNSASIQIYNMSRETELKVCKAGNKIILRAGYEDENISSLFFGNIIKSESKKEGSERVVSIEALDGNKQYGTKKISCSFAAGTKAYIVADTLFNMLALPVIGKENINKNIEYTIGYSFIGLTKAGLSEVLSHCNCSWTIQNESILVIKEGGTIQDTGLLLTASSGLISIDGAEDAIIKGKTKKTPKKMVVKTMLFPQLIPGAKCRIKSVSKNIDAFFKIRSGKYFGDNRGGDFCNELEVDAI